ncbi:MAG: hypothetical protein ACLT98_08155 [Eggerthellaceae bacterium]
METSSRLRSHLTVDNYEEGWDGEVGLVTKPFESIEVDAENTFGVLCGPTGHVSLCRRGNAQERHRTIVSI